MGNHTSSLALVCHPKICDTGAIPPRRRSCVDQPVCTAVQSAGVCTGAKARGAKQQAIVALAEERAAAAPPGLTDEQVADQSMVAVRQRWCTADPAGMTVLRTVVHTVTRRVRRGDSEDDVGIMESFEQQTITDVVATAPDDSFGWPPNLEQWMVQHPNLLPQLIELRRCQIDAKVALTRIEAETEQKRLETEAPRTLAEAQRLKAEAGLVRAHTAAEKRKRTPDDDIEARSAVAWNGMHSLSAAVWAGRPADCVEDLRVVYTRLTTALPDGIRQRVRVLPQTRDVVVVYVVVRVLPPS